jgi:hypothetical protein
MEHYACDLDSALLPNLTTDRILRRLSRLEKPRQGAVPVRWPALFAAEEQRGARGGNDGGDDGGVGARECEIVDAGPGGARRPRLGARWSGKIYGRTHALVARVDGEGLVAAGSAEGVAVVPVDYGASLRVDGGYRQTLLARWLEGGEGGGGLVVLRKTGIRE